MHFFRRKDAYMIKQDEALAISNPRLLAAVYFSLLAVIITLSLDTLLYLLGVKQLLPISEAIILAVLVSALFGALFGEKIIHSENPYYKHAFLWAFLMVLVAFPFYNLGFVYLMTTHQSASFTHATFQSLVYFYLFVLTYSFVLIGVWLAIIAGFAALYLRGYIVYFILHSQYQRRKHG